MSSNITVEEVRKQIAGISNPNLGEYEIKQYGLPGEAVLLRRGETDIICSKDEDGCTIFAITPKVDGRSLMEIFGGAGDVVRGVTSLVDAIEIAEYAYAARSSTFMLEQLGKAVDRYYR